MCSSPISPRIVGLLVAGDLHLIQLRTRRPVCSIRRTRYSDVLVAAGAAMQRIPARDFGLDLSSLRRCYWCGPRIPALSHQNTWESFTPDKWRAIRRDFGVTQVLAYADWTLQLPVSSHSRRLLLYDIPDR